MSGPEGPNGAAETTTIEILTTRLEPTQPKETCPRS